MVQRDERQSRALWRLLACMTMMCAAVATGCANPAGGGGPSDAAMPDTGVLFDEGMPGENDGDVPPPACPPGMQLDLETGECLAPPPERNEACWAAAGRAVECMQSQQCFQGRDIDDVRREAIYGDCVDGRIIATVVNEANDCYEAIIYLRGNLIPSDEPRSATVANECQRICESGEEPCELAPASKLAGAVAYGYLDSVTQPGVLLPGHQVEVVCEEQLREDDLLYCETRYWFNWEAEDLPYPYREQEGARENALLYCHFQAVVRPTLENGDTQYCADNERRCSEERCGDIYRLEEFALLDEHWPDTTPFPCVTGMNRDGLQLHMLTINGEQVLWGTWMSRPNHEIEGEDFAMCIRDWREIVLDDVPATGPMEWSVVPEAYRGQ